MNVRQSSSSSNDRLPRGGWVLTWALTALYVITPLAGLELWWRGHGFGPEVQAVDQAWIVNWHRLPRLTTIALGTSRIRAALDPVAFQHVAGGTRPVNFALPGSSPIPVLEYLADSTDYRGVVIVELLPLMAFEATQAASERVASLLERYAREHVSPGRLSENWLEVHLIRHLVFRAPQLLPVRLINTLSKGGVIQPTIGRMRPDGFAPRDQRSLRVTRAWDPVMGFAGHDYGWMRAVHPSTDAEFAVLKDRINRASDRILARGGTVVLLFMAACGERLGIEERLYPRSRYWDVLARATNALAIATPDYPGLSRFECFDGSHLDAADAPAFATALARLVGQHGQPESSPADSGRP